MYNMEKRKYENPYKAVAPVRILSVLAQRVFTLLPFIVFLFLNNTFIKFHAQSKHKSQTINL